jgi:hypothetical protein
MLTQHSLGWIGPDKIECVVTNRAGATVAVGAVLMLDRRLADGDSLSNALGGAQVGIANGITPGAATTDQMVTEIFGVVQRSAVDNAKTVLRLKGFCDVVTFGAGDDVVLATSRVFITASARNVTAVNGAQENSGTAAAVMRKVVFLPHTAVVTPGSTDGWWDGINGFGTILFT